ncbi:proteasome subunit beta [Candidatus Woesearchaeota archaeon]|nr:proteasome subunit beta [Candidatus Woesearchaeota archaeon]
MSEDKNILKTGTTTVGVLAKDSVILAADKRATAGSLIVDKTVEKVIPITDNLALTLSGSVSDVQVLIKYLKAELALKELKTGRVASVREAANLLSAFTYSGIRSRGSITHFIIGGYDSTGAHLYDIFPDGSLTEIKPEVGFVTSGSGMVYALGVLEDSYKEGLTEDESVDLCFRAIGSALKRDNASGEGVDVFVINKNGVKKLAQKLISNKLN